jgi:hypothetical protein
MTKTSVPKQHNVPTTNFVINLDKINIDALQEKYQLFTIEVPDSYIYSQDKQKYPKLHNTYKEQLELPYFFYTHAKPKASIFILVDKSKKPEKSISLTFDFLKGEKVIAQEKNIIGLCTQSNLHILAKLFLSDYFYNHKKTYRICQGKFYIHSRVDKKWATVLEISGLKHIEGTEEFCFDQKATFMVQIEKNKENTQYVSSNVYCELVDGEIYYRQLKTSHANKLLSDTKSTQNIWKVVTGSPTNKPSIKWFEDYENITRCKSTLLQEFQNRLLKHFNKCLGETGVAKQQNHKMIKLDAIKQTTIQGYGETGLNINLLGKVGLLDLRFKEIEKPNQIPFQQYVDFFNKHYQYSTLKSDFGFVEIKREDLATNKMPILVLQDVEKRLFEPEEKDKEGTITQKAGFLFEAGYSDDPKLMLYNEFADRIPLQTMNVNTNEVNEHLLDTYFDYEMLGDCLKHLGKSYKEIGENLEKAEEKIKEAYKQEKEKFGEVSEETKNLRKQNEKLKKHFSLVTNKINVCLNELLLKHYIVNKLPIKGNVNNPYLYLPCISQIPNLVNYAYMYRNTFMYVDNQYILQFLNLDSPSKKQKRNEFLQNWGIDWFEFEKQFAKRNYTQGNEEKTLDKLKKTHFVFAKNLVLAVEDTEERVLHIYDPKKKGQSQRKQEQKTALEGIFYSKEKQIYTVGYTSLNQTADDSVKIRRLYYYQRPDNFKINDLLQTLSVQFVRNKQYTVYPYFFDLLNLYRETMQ